MDAEKTETEAEARFTMDGRRWVEMSKSKWIERWGVSAGGWDRKGVEAVTTGRLIRARLKSRE